MYPGRTASVDQCFYYLQICWFIGHTNKYINDAFFNYLFIYFVVGVVVFPLFVVSKNLMGTIVKKQQQQKSFVANI